MHSKRADETNLEWQYRVFELKIKRETDLDWSEIKELLGLDETVDSIRKKARGAVEYKMFLDSQPVKDDEGLKEQIEALEQKTKEANIATIKMRDQTREYRRYLRHEGRLENLLQVMIEQIKDDLNNKSPIIWEPPIKQEWKDEAFMLLLSDLHRGMVTDNSWNKFNEEEFNNRINQLYKEVVEYQNLTKVSELHIMGLGDYIEGTLHRLTKIGETEDAVIQTQRVAEALAELISKLSSKFEKVYFYSVRGNHERVSSRKEEEINTESFHEFIPWYIKARLENHNNITFPENEIDDSIIIAEVLGKTYFGVHGHLDGTASAIQNLSLMTRKFPEAVVMGHFHKNFENEIHGIDLIVNSGFAGTNGYAKDKRLTGKAGQKLLWLSKEGRKAQFYINFTNGDIL